jgi:hypothetical protein
MDVTPGQWWQRVLAVLLVAGTVWLYLERAAYGVPGAILWIAAVLSMLFTLLSIPPLYRRWMSFATWLSVWMTRLLFSVVYVVVVPFTWAFYSLSGRGKGGSHAGDSLWIPKRKHDRTVEDLERMG